MSQGRNLKVIMTNWHTIADVKLAENWSIVQRWLQSALDNDQRQYIEPTPGTTQWVTSQSNPSYYKWLEEGDHRLLLFDGPPGGSMSIPLLPLGLSRRLTDAILPN